MHPHCSYFANSALLPTGWADNVLIAVDKAGYITDVSCNPPPNNAIHFEGAMLPGMLNLHSHAFQRAMAGLAERATAEKESFWTWRETMYRFLEKLTPEDLQAIAAQVYIEMLKAGFTTVGEFHYIHHQPNGTPYQERCLTSHHIISAAQEVGIAITLLPVLYSYSGFGGQKPTVNQKRFINNETQILDIISSLVKAYKDEPQVIIGLAHHSLRAVTPDMLQHATAAMKHIAPQSPIHIHIAEQTKEVTDCLQWSGQRPVEWLLNHVDINSHWCLVHATHMTAHETQRLAHSGAVAGLCPITEANLGDGLFNLPEYIREKGKWGIGTDSNISVSIVDELRMLEYGQRLIHHERAITKTPTEPSVGTVLYQQALLGGTRALGRPAGSIEIGNRADFIILDTQNPSLLFKSNSLILDAMIFAGNANPVRHVIAGGQHVVKNFRHIAEDEVLKAYTNTIKTYLHR
ncbi:formimidoylglutamate deiminase [Legionella micdadei]|uniref:Formimidoylglutamate deiminase n=2 Tax=Legionella micdadei TaxID=451 RepID=A0A098GCT9_LEGMI|nr:formimidoylglutamate deiminase [Legionella micdadei]NSL18432.1 formimidoylglutamate deiminase [Legionella micdadei]CEG59815.1 S-adenosylhomocysteine deaminase [Legionella micdadei]SCY51187.1 formimidoylglutamate deiminase [Legionella micdadei]